MNAPTPHNIVVFTRIMLKIEHQIDRAFREGRVQDAQALARLSGRLLYEFFGLSICRPLEVA